MSSFKVVTVGLPKLLQDIVCDWLSKPADIELIGQFGSIDEFDKQRDIGEIHIVIVETKKDREYADFLLKYPSVRVISFLCDGRDCAIWELIILKQELRDISPNQLVNLISE